MPMLTGFGLSIDSDRDVPGALPATLPDQGPADLRIATLDAFVPDPAPPPVYRWANPTLTFSAEGVARYACRRESIEVAAERNADPAMVTALLVATALPAVMWLRGETMLHAAGVVAPSGCSALAIAGPSGIGKSALTAELLAAGGSVLADDSICLRRYGDRIEGSGLPGGYHRVERGSRDFRPIPPDRAASAATIGAVVILDRTDGAPSLARLNAVAALEALLANLHRRAVPALLDRRPETLATMAFIASRLPVYAWRRSAVALSMAERDMLAREELW